MIKRILNKLPKAPTPAEFMKMGISEYTARQALLTKTIGALSWWERGLYYAYLDWNSIRINFETADTFPGRGLKAYLVYESILIVLFGGRLAPVVRGKIRRFFNTE